MLKRIIKSKRGEMYIDVAIMVLVAMMLLALALNLFTFFSLKQDLDHYAKEMIRTATVYGKTDGTEIRNRSTELDVETNLDPAFTFTATYFNATAKTVQFGDSITVILTYETEFKGFGIIKIPITLTAKHSGLSQRYWT